MKNKDRNNIEKKFSLHNKYYRYVYKTKALFCVLFSDLGADNRKWDAPYPCLHDVGSLLLMLEENPSSIDSYNKKYNITIPFNGVAHHPMYDSVAAAVAWEHATQKLRSLR